MARTDPRRGSKLTDPSHEITVLLTVGSQNGEVVQELLDDLEVVGWGVPIARTLRRGVTFLTYHIEVRL